MILDKSIDFNELQWKKALFILANKGDSKLDKSIASNEEHLEKAESMDSNEEELKYEKSNDTIFSTLGHHRNKRTFLNFSKEN